MRSGCQNRIENSHKAYFKKRTPLPEVSTVKPNDRAVYLAVLKMHPAMKRYHATRIIRRSLKLQNALKMKQLAIIRTARKILTSVDKLIKEVEGCWI